MVMSMDTAADQVIGSSMEESALSIRHQESADEELNMDEQSKASCQTVVDALKTQQQSLMHPKQSTLADESQQQKHEMAEQQTQVTAAMVMSRESSLENDDDKGDEQKIMMHMDYEANISIKRNITEKLETDKRFEDRSDLSMKDPVVARMRDIVEGNQSQCQVHQQYQQQQQQQKSSSGDSLNNQITENDSKTFADGAQQKRSRQARHCGRHHHHHHHHHHQQHHRQSLGTNIGADGQATLTGHHHHHHHHRSGGHHHAHRHHHHHHHAHQHEQQQHHHQRSDHHHSGPSTMSTADAVTSGDQTNASQRPLGDSESCKHSHQAIVSSFSQTETSKQTGESKSSNSSVSSTPLDHHQQTQQHEVAVQSSKTNNHEPPLNESSEAIIGSKSDLREGEQEERCAHHQTCHYHNHIHPSSSSQQHQHPPPHHHHHHHHCHGRHHHQQRNYKKRLVVDAGDEQPLQLVDGQSDNPNAQHESIDKEHSRDKQQELIVDSTNPKNLDARIPLQDISGSQTSNQINSSSCCPHHEHHYSGQQSRGTIVKLHHHHHHHHQNLANQQARKEATSDQQQHRAHHYHHHRHHHHHKARTRKHKTSNSNTNINDPDRQKEHNTDADPTIAVIADSTRDVDTEGTRKDVGYATCDRDGSLSLEREQLELETKMHLDNTEEGHQQSTQTESKCSADKSSSEIVNMEISPNSDNKQGVRGSLANRLDQLVESKLTDSNDVIAAIDTSQRAGATRSGTNDQLSSNNTENDKRNQQQEQAKDSDFQAQGVSGNEATKNNSVHEFTRSQEGDSMKQSSGNKDDRLVGQVSRENSRKDMVSKAGAGASKQQNQQQQSIEFSPIQTDDQYQQSNQQRQIVESTVSPDRRCRLCWCCCCPCSGLSSRNNVSKTETKQNVVDAPSSTGNKCQALANIPLEKIRSWSESFDRLMKCSDGRRIFQDFLRCEYSEENILFWIACEELKHEKDSKSIATKARDIYEDYISILSAKEVSLDSRVRDVINNNIKKPTSNIFDEAQLQIYTLMHRDSYPRFINSPMYKKLAQIQTSSSRKGST